MSNDFDLSSWSLQDLLAEPTEQSINTYLSQLEETVVSLEADRQRLTPDMDTGLFLDFLHRYEVTNRLIMRLGAYAYLWFAQDTQNPAALNLRGRLDQVLTGISNRILFFSLWFKGLPEEAAERLITASGDMRYFLESQRRFKSYTLTEAEEKIINIKDVNGIEAVIKLYEMITNRFTFTLEVDGEKKTLTRDQLSAYYRHPSPEVRAATFKELFRVYEENATLLAQIYEHRVRDWQAEALELRGYAQPISPRNLSNDIPDGVVDSLLEACRQNAAIFQRYFRLKAKWLGLEKLRRYDIYAPLAPADKSYTFAQAVELVLSSFAGFSPEVAEQARRVFAQNHLDAENRPGKRGGAFCYSSLPELTPWVLVNFTGKARDVATLAHELGHAVHSMQASGHSLLTYHAPLPLAETASVFAEMVLTERLLHEESDPAVRRDLLARAIDDTYATVMRQAYFAIFERDAHRMIVEGKPVEELTAHYLKNLAEQFGDAVEVGEEFRWEWITIPHIYSSPFYVYSYSLGQLLVLALFQMYRTEGASFIPRYLKILSYGGSASPVAILQEAGIDIASTTFWQGGFDVLKGMIEQLEQIEN